MSRPYDEAWRALDAELLEAEAELEREKEWLQEDNRRSLTEDDLLQGWVHDLRDIGDYTPPAA